MDTDTTNTDERKKKHIRWLQIMLFIEIIYVIFELGFNASLFNATGGAVSSLDAILKIENSGRLISSFGFGLVVFAYMRRKKVMATFSTEIRPLLITLVLAVPFFFVFQFVVMKMIFVESASPKELQASYRAKIYQEMIVHGLAPSALPYGDGYRSDPEHMAIFSLIPLSGIHSEKVQDYIIKNADRAAFAPLYYAAEPLLDRHYDTYTKISDKMREFHEVYYETYRDNSEVRNQVNKATNKLWAKVDSESKVAYNKYLDAYRKYQNVAQKGSRFGARQAKKTFFNYFGFDPAYYSLTEFREKSRMRIGGEADVNLWKWDGTSAHFKRIVLSDLYAKFIVHKVGLNEYVRSGISPPPSSSFAEFSQSELAYEIAGYRSQPFIMKGAPMGLPKAEYKEKVFKELINIQAKDRKNNLLYKEVNFTKNGSGEHVAKESMSSSTIPIVALVFSLFFTTIMLVKIPLRIIHISWIKAPRAWKLWLKKALFAADLGIICILPFKRFHNDLFDSPEGVRIMADIGEQYPVAKYPLEWIMRAQPVIYPYGQTILNTFGLDVRDERFRDSNNDVIPLISPITQKVGLLFK